MIARRSEFNFQFNTRKIMAIAICADLLISIFGTIQQSDPSMGQDGTPGLQTREPAGRCQRHPENDKKTENVTIARTLKSMELGATDTPKMIRKIENVAIAQDIRK